MKRSEGTRGSRSAGAVLPRRRRCRRWSHGPRCRDAHAVKSKPSPRTDMASLAPVAIDQDAETPCARSARLVSELARSSALASRQCRRPRFCSARSRRGAIDGTRCAWVVGVPLWAAAGGPREASARGEEEGAGGFMGLLGMWLFEETVYLFNQQLWARVKQRARKKNFTALETVSRRQRRRAAARPEGGSAGPWWTRADRRGSLHGPRGAGPLDARKQQANAFLAQQLDLRITVVSAGW